MHSIHTADWASAAWKLACWMAQRGRDVADAEAGEYIARVEYTGKDEDEVKRLAANNKDMCPRDRVPRAPVFNVVDEDNTDQRKILDVVGQAFKVETGFVNAAITAWAKVNFSGVVDDINAKHLEMVVELVKHIKDPGYVDGTSPLTCVLEADLLVNRALALDGSKITRITGWKPTQHLSTEALLAIRSEFNTQAPEAWPPLVGQ
ncbi:unnamed protein product [Tilletia laevis]|uniref:Uncharacterized protein n=4 Tax=Tilletia TaxID=13289 RepID=A0A8X7MIP9_9BASI|nr:hypothetical protein CF336_g9111 [Tilletia laevis]KAE8181805.1 hypothetical protein CF328_g8725 [Tilletia controversa]KAE8238427.1 hypothetical protein A4X03_0g8864 [Tilletia caries]KAE8185037.1 hypothetical protein CF335_g7845 [Tilletia laevis]KAE8237502.1 hypothetical protein A4X06_0g9209 [Tilletia controversa]